MTDLVEACALIADLRDTSHGVRLSRKAADTLAALVAEVERLRVKPVSVAEARSFPGAANGMPPLPMEAELWGSGCDVETARFVAQQLAAQGFHLSRVNITSEAAKVLLPIFEQRHATWAGCRGRDPASYLSPHSATADALRAIAEGCEA